MIRKITAPTIVTGIVLASCLVASPALADDTTTPVDETTQSTIVETPQVTEQVAPLEEPPAVVEAQPAAEPIVAPPAAKVAPVTAPAAAPVAAPAIAPDTTKPIVTLGSAPVVFNNGTQLVVSATDDTGLTKIVANIYKNGSLVKSSQSPASGTSGSHTVNFASLGLADGSYVLRYNALDTAGNVASTKEFAFQLDNTAPTITDKGGVTTSNDRQKSGSYKLYDAGKIAYVTVNGVVKDLTDNVWSDLNGLKPGTFGAVEGANTIVAYDVAGNQSAPLVVVLDTTGPIFTIKPEGTVGADGFYQKLSVKLNDGANVVKAILNDVEKNLTPNVWSDLNDIKPGTFGAVEGLNTLVLVDALGNQSTYTFTIDTTKPVVNVPAANQWVSGVHTWNITQVEANPAKTYIEIQQMVDGKWKKFAGMWYYDTNAFDAAFDTTVLTDNVQTQIKISTWDKAGNQSGASFAVKVDNSAPKITVKPESIGANDVFSDLDLKLYDGLSGVDKISVNGVVKDLSNNTWSDLNDIKPGKYGAVDGENTIVLQDVAGNTTSLVVTLDGTAPTVTTKVHEWQTKDGGRDSITLTFSEPVTGLPQGWYGSGTTWTKVFYNTKPATVTFVDQAGNKGSYTLTPNAAPVVETPSTPTVTQPQTTTPTGTQSVAASTVSSNATYTGTLPATGLSPIVQAIAASGIGALILGILAKLKSIFS